MQASRSPIRVKLVSTLAVAIRLSPSVIALFGPTGIGKTAVAVALVKNYAPGESRR